MCFFNSQRLFCVENLSLHGVPKLSANYKYYLKTQNKDKEYLYFWRKKAPYKYNIFIKMFVNDKCNE